MSAQHPYTPALEKTKEMIELTKKKLALLNKLERTLWYLSHFNLDPKTKVYPVISWNKFQLVDPETKKVVAEAPLKSIPHEYLPDEYQRTRRRTR